MSMRSLESPSSPHKGNTRHAPITVCEALLKQFTLPDVHAVQRSPLRRSLVPDHPVLMVLGYANDTSKTPLL